MESRHQPRRQLQHDRVQHEQEEAERHHRQRQRDDEQQRFHERVQQAEDQRRDRNRHERVVAEVRRQGDGHDQQRHGVQQPAEDEIPDHDCTTSMLRDASSCMKSSGGTQRSCGSAPFVSIWPRAIISATIAAGNAVVRIIALRPVASS